MAFTHLHLHTEYSLLDGMCRIKPLMARAKELGMTSVAITDHGMLHGVIKFYQAAKAAGIKPIIGCETYVAATSRLNKGVGDRSGYHLILLAMNKTGYDNLINLISEANLDGFYYKPRVDHELLEKYNEGLICTSACIAGEVPDAILRGDLEEAKKQALWYKNIFKDRYYIEIQRHPIPKVEHANQFLIPLARELDIPLVATNDVHYLYKEDAEYHDLLLCIGTQSQVNDEKRMRMDGPYFYFKSEEEMREMFKDIPDAIENTQKIADMCNLELEFGRSVIPYVERPEGLTEDEYLKQICYEGLDAYYKDNYEEAKKRLDYELDVIEQLKFSEYFLVVRDIVKFARDNHIAVNVRGSGSGSIVLRCTGITKLDPLKHNLVFERFLNLERKEMPDIDLDFDYLRRHEVVEYVVKKYGSDHVAQICSFNTLGAKGVIRDVGRVLGIPLSDVNRIANLIPEGPKVTLDSALNGSKDSPASPDFKAMYDNNPVAHDLIDKAMHLEGLARGTGVHAAGIVISQEPLTVYTPLMRCTKDLEGEIGQTQWDMDDIHEIGLIKMDFLGLVNLTIISETQRLVKEHRGEDVDIQNIPLDDQATFDLLSNGETIGVFQLEGNGMRNFIKQLRPTCFADLSALVALYRPGPLDYIPDFIKSKHGEKTPVYPHPILEKYLGETYGIIVYQEQVIFMVTAIGGYTLGQADIFRKAISKKKADIVAREKPKFLDGAEKNGYSREIAEAVYAMIEPFAGYAFNKAHAVSYGLVAYQTAYLKAHYPEEYLAAIMAGYWDKPEKVALTISESRRLGIEVLPPNINKSRVSFSLEDTGGEHASIRFGLSTIKNVGVAAVEHIIEERDKNGIYESLEDLVKRNDTSYINKRVLESLIKAGALDDLGGRRTMLGIMEQVLEIAQHDQKIKSSGQFAMFDMWEQTATPKVQILNEQEDDLAELLAWEKELTGVYLSQHPFSPYAEQAANDGVTQIVDINDDMQGNDISIAGLVAEARVLNTKTGNKGMSAKIEDIAGTIEVVCWSKAYELTADMWKVGNVLHITGKLEKRNDNFQINCKEARIYTLRNTDEAVPEYIKKAAEAQKIVKAEPIEMPAPNTHPHNVMLHSNCKRAVLTLTETGNADDDINRLRRLADLISQNKGNDEVVYRIVSGRKITEILMRVRVKCDDNMESLFVEQLGRENVKIEEETV
jgi:DNA polymerase-3 subunit alpha